MDTTVGVTELHLVTNSLQVSARFWAAIWPNAAVELGERLRIRPATGPVLVIAEAEVEAAITPVDLRVVAEAGAAARLEAEGFEVAVNGSRAIEVNGTGSMVWLD